MNERKIATASQEDERSQQNGPVKCFEIEELERFALEGSQAPSAELIRRHLDTNCPRCTEYVTDRKTKRARAESLLDEVRKIHDEDAHNGFARVRARMEKNQQSDHPEDLRTATRQRRSLGIPTWRLEFRLPSPKKLHHGLTVEPHALSKDLDASCQLKILRYEPKEGRFELAMQFAPSLEHLAAELLLEGDYRIRLARERLSETAEENGETVEVTREVWVTGPLTLDQFRLVAGQRRVEIELYEIAEAATVGAQPDGHVQAGVVAEASGDSKPIAAT